MTNPLAAMLRSLGSRQALFNASAARAEALREDEALARLVAALSRRDQRGPDSVRTAA